MSMSDLAVRIESYLKRNVDLDLYAKLDEDGVERFFRKCTYELSLHLCPKKSYGVSKNVFHDLITDVFFKIFSDDLRYDFALNKLYCYETFSGEPRLVIARTKKAALEIVLCFGYDFRDTIAHRKSLRKVVGIGESLVLLDNDEERHIADFWLQTINLFGGAEGGEL